MSRPDLDVLVVGAGFAGLYMLHLLRERGYRARVAEAGSGVGGTWYWNRYPGARCDIPSIEYSYSFSPELESEWRWTERYAAQPEIRRYLEHVADRFDLKRDIMFDTRVTAAHWDEAGQYWRVAFADRPAITARHVVMATGSLSAPKLPDWPGIEEFAGEIVHSAQWRDDVALAGKRVGLVGVGSSGVQALPQIARVADTLTVFVRTPSFCVPASNRPLDDAEVAEVRQELPKLREDARNSLLGWFDGILPGSAKAASAEERAERFEVQWNAGTTGLLRAYEDLLVDEEANAHCAAFARGKIAALVEDADKARIMTPQGYPVGSRRLVSEIGYFDALNRANVTLVDIAADPVERVEGDAVVTGGGRYPVDVLVFATGFNAMVGALAAIDIRGRDGAALTDEWADGPRAYLGLAVSGFPNFFTVTGPGSPSVLSNMVVSIEQHAEWIADCLDHLRDADATTIEPDAKAEGEWMVHVDQVAQQTLFPRSASWYQGRTRDGRLVFMPYVGGVGAYRATCAEVAADGYRGFVIQ